MTGPALELHDISKQFGSVRALDGVSFTATAGSVHALLGENGAGKTTLMRIAFGMIRPDAGLIAVNGTHRTFASPAEAIVAGIGMVHQQFSLVPAMTVTENVALGGKGRLNNDEIAKTIREIGRTTGLFLDPAARVADMGSAERQKLEIVRTLAHDANVLILDEPTAVLTPRDTGELFGQLRLFADAGGSVVLITHKLHDALEHADEVTVLRHGRVVLSASMSEMTEASLAEAMLGAAHVAAAGPSREFPPARDDTRAVAVLDNVVAGTDNGQSFSFALHGGEVVGVAALEGAARSLLRTLAGRMKPRSGSARIPAGVSFVPENRQDEALISDFTLAENLALRNAGERSGLIDWSDIRRRTARVIEDFDVKATSGDSPIRNLSGGNQQRFLLGRELQGSPPLLVLENPTQGLDVRAAVEVHARVRSARQRGVAVVFYSSDLDELVEISDRVLVVSATSHAWCEPARDAIGRLLLETEKAGG